MFLCLSFGECSWCGKDGEECSGCVLFPSVGRTMVERDVLFWDRHVSPITSDEGFLWVLLSLFTAAVPLIIIPSRHVMIYEEERLYIITGCYVAALWCLLFGLCLYITFLIREFYYWAKQISLDIHGVQINVPRHRHHYDRSSMSIVELNIQPSTAARCSCPRTWSGIM
ncbi:hypothetical protein BJX96DRAFT_27309 [Aspergillus floccosus]